MIRICLLSNAMNMKRLDFDAIVNCVDDGTMDV